MLLCHQTCYQIVRDSRIPSPLGRASNHLRMSKPTLSTLAQIAEIVAAVGVIVSLVYVGRELQANTTAIRGAAVQEVTRAQAELLLTRVNNAELFDLYERGNRHPATLNESELGRYGLLKRQTWINLENVFFQYDLGLLDERTWGVYHRTICGIWSTPGSKETWSGHRRVLDESFVRLVEACEDPQGAA